MDPYPHPVIVGHRGARASSLIENSRDSFQWAIAHQAREVETDCRMTSDGTIIQFHNEFYLDAKGTRHLVSERTYAQVKHDLPFILTLAELIEFVDRRARLMLEIKPGVPAEPIIKTLRRYLKRGWTPSDFSFASFDYFILRDVQRALPQIDRIVLESWSGLRALWRARQLNTTYLSMNQQYLWWGFILWATRHNHKIYTYPHSRTKFKFNHKKPAKWVKHGLHGIITDQPELF